MAQDPDKYGDVLEDPVQFDTTVEITVPNSFTYTRKLMCLTLSGLPVPIITITAAKNNAKKTLK